MDHLLYYSQQCRYCHLLCQQMATLPTAARFHYVNVASITRPEQMPPAVPTLVVANQTYVGPAAFQWVQAELQAQAGPQCYDIGDPSAGMQFSDLGDGGNTYRSQSYSAI